MLGCNLHCWFCQNWYTSQTLRDAHASTSGLTRCTPAELVQAAEANDAPVIASTYNEPIITSEWSHAVFSLAKVRGLSTCYVTNGHGTTELWDYLAPCLDAANVDLKCFTSEGYRRLGGRLEAVRESIATLERLGVWVEVTTLVVPGFNDDPAELRAAAEFLVSISPDIPWHLSAFHPDYRCRDVGPTPLSLLMDTADTGRSAGLRYVYIGNVASRDGGTTFCPACGEAVVKRSGFRVQALALRDGCCSACGAPIAGHWG
jgi:pyruvate formate lyase activating enzyme